MRVTDVVKKTQDLTALSWDERATSSGTAGTYLKSRKGTDAKTVYYKLSRFNGIAIDGHESVNEIVASRLMELLGVPHLRYRLIHARILIDGTEHVTWLNASNSFRAKGERKQALGMFYDLHKNADESPYEFCCRQGWQEEIHQMMVVDYLIANRDRHASNIEVLVSPDGVARLAPFFDQGFSLVAPLADNEERVSAFEPLKSVGTVNFVGTRSLEENLSSAGKPFDASALQESDRERLFAGLEETVSPVHLEKMWEIIWLRWCHYAEI